MCFVFNDEAKLEQLISVSVCKLPIVVYYLLSCFNTLMIALLFKLSLFTIFATQVVTNIYL
ncbi:hypothetical protein DMZ43_06705 [Meridianimaribacter sp. CL38]|nr:hypothetical protein DMZ43_06705 [Meridianimaribacter sp. CL38]